MNRWEIFLVLVLLVGLIAERPVGKGRLEFSCRLGGGCMIGTEK